MTSSSSTPDISTLSLSSKPSQQRLHDTYDYEGNASGNGRNPYHYSTSPPIPAPSQYNPLGVSQSPLKNKTMRGGLPSVSLALSFSPCDALIPCRSSNGWTTASQWETPVPCPRTTIRTSRPLAVHPRCPMSSPPQSPQALPVKTTRLYPPRSSSRTYHST